jgi:hypothetical protein
MPDSRVGTPRHGLRSELEERFLSCLSGLERIGRKFAHQTVDLVTVGGVVGRPQGDRDGQHAQQHDSY